MGEQFIEAVEGGGIYQIAAISVGRDSLDEYLVGAVSGGRDWQLLLQSHYVVLGGGGVVTGKMYLRRALHAAWYLPSESFL